MCQTLLLPTQISHLLSLNLQAYITTFWFYARIVGFDALRMNEIDLEKYPPEALAAAMLHLVAATVEMNGQPVIDHLYDDLTHSIPPRIRIALFQSICSLIDSDKAYRIPPQFSHPSVIEDPAKRIEAAIAICLFRLERDSSDPH